MRRPLMWFCFLGIAVVFLITVLVDHYNPPPEFQNEMIVSGKVYKKEIRNDRLILYLKECIAEYPDDTKSHDTNNLKEYEFQTSIKESDYYQSSVEEEFQENHKESNNNKDNNKDNYKLKGFICYLDQDDPEDDSISLYPVGSHLTVQGKISTIKKATNPGEYDAYRYYRARGYEYTSFNPEIKECYGRNPIMNGLFLLKSEGCNILLEGLGEEYGGVACAILFGNKTYLSSDIKDLFTEGGIAHILAISGLHISLIGAFLYAVFNHRPIPMWVAFVITVLMLVLYGFMAGLAPSAFRAVFMFSYRLLAKLLKKPYDMPTSLVVSAFLTCSLFPYMVLDSSFQLSYLSVAGIIFLFPLFLPFVNRKKKRTDGLFIGFSVFIADLPVLAVSFHQISLTGFVLNFFVLPAMPVLFVCAFGVILFWNFLHPFAYLLAVVCKAILYTFSYGSYVLTKIPFSNFGVKSPSVRRIIIYTTFVVALSLLCTFFRRYMKLSFYKFSRPEEKENDELERKGFRIVEIFYRACVFMAFMVLCLFLLSTPKKGIVTFLDVGQGDGIFIRTDSGDIFMIDGGSTSKTKVGENIIVPYLKYEGENEVDLWILTHEDTDHVNGFKEVLEGDEIRICAIALPSALKEEFTETIRLATEKDVDILYLEAGDFITGSKKRIVNLFSKEDYSFIVVSPDPTEEYHDSNAASLTLLYQEGENSYVFMGDAELQAENAMLEAWNKYGDGCLEVLKCAHHGSANNTNTEVFIKALKPQYAIISCGKNNRYGHPHRETLEYLEETGTEIFRTDEIGAIECE